MAKQSPEQARPQPLSLTLPGAVGLDRGQVSCALHPHPGAHCHLARCYLVPGTFCADTGSPAWGPSLWAEEGYRISWLSGTGRGQTSLPPFSLPPIGSVLAIVALYKSLQLYPQNAITVTPKTKTPFLILAWLASRNPANLPKPPNSPAHLGTPDSTTPGWPWPSSP